MDARYSDWQHRLASWGLILSAAGLAFLGFWSLFQPVTDSDTGQQFSQIEVLLIRLATLAVVSAWAAVCYLLWRSIGSESRWDEAPAIKKFFCVALSPASIAIFVVSGVVLMAFAITIGALIGGGWKNFTRL